MARSRLKKKKKLTISSSTIDENIQDETKVPIPNLPETFLWMKVKSGTKMKNVLGHALREFSNNKCVVWSGAGQAIGKVISCAEIFKRKLSGLHQITKLRYIESKCLDEKEETTRRQVPEIHILLSKNPLDTKEPGYQAPGVSRAFQDFSLDADKHNEQDYRNGNGTRMSNATAEEFAAMGLRTGQKRQRRDNPSDSPTRKTNKRESSK